MAGSQNSLRRLVLSASFLLCFALNTAAPVCGQVTTNQVLRFAADVRRLSPEQAGKHQPVRLKGVVTFHDGALFSRFLQDETAGIISRS